MPPPPTDPESDLARIRELVTEFWGIDGRVDPLVGFADSNFRLTTDRCDRFVLKIAPPGTSLEWLQCQISTMLHLEASPMGSLVPRVIPTGSGQILLHLDEGFEQPRWARLMTYLEGAPLAKVTRRPLHLLGEIGRTLAQLDLALSDFDHPGAHREFSWDLMTTPDNVNLAKYIDDSSRRRLVEDHLRRFKTQVTPRLSDLDHAVIHNDGNDYNLLVSNPEEGDPHLTGLIDFGDVLYTATISEIAISCAYLMLERDDPWKDAEHLIRGYDSVRSLTLLERDLLPDLVIGRLCTSLLFSAYGRHSNPDNAYLQVSETPMWRLLETLVTTDSSRFSSTVENACR